MDVHSLWFQHFASEYETRIGDAAVVDRTLRETGLARSNLSSTAESIDPVKMARFLDVACETLGEPEFAAKAGLKFKESSHLVGYIAKYSRNLRAAIENTARYSLLVDGNTSYSLNVSGNHAFFEVEYADDSIAKFRRWTEFALFCALSRMRSLTGVDFIPLELRFRHILKSSGGGIGAIARCSVVFGAETTGIILPLSALDLTIPTYDLALRRHLTEYGDRLLKELPNKKASLRSEIEGLLLAGLPGRILPAEEVASSLGMSRRSFARRLNEQCLSYREIVDGIRCDLAQAYLNGGYQIAEVAFFLDYADQAAFSTAFKRWTGTTPGNFRAQYRAA